MSVCVGVCVCVSVCVCVCECVCVCDKEGEMEGGLDSENYTHKSRSAGWNNISIKARCRGGFLLTHHVSFDEECRPPCHSIRLQWLLVQSVCEKNYSDLKNIATFRF